MNSHAVENRGLKKHNLTTRTVVHIDKQRYVKTYRNRPTHLFYAHWETGAGAFLGLVTSSWQHGKNKRRKTCLGKKSARSFLVR